MQDLSENCQELAVDQITEYVLHSTVLKQILKEIIKTLNHEQQLCEHLHSLVDALKPTEEKENKIILKVLNSKMGF